MLQSPLQGAGSQPDEPSSGLRRRTEYFQASPIWATVKTNILWWGKRGGWGVIGTLCWKVRGKTEQCLPHTLVETPKAIGSITNGFECSNPEKASYSGQKQKPLWPRKGMFLVAQNLEAIKEDKVDT